MTQEELPIKAIKKDLIMPGDFAPEGVVTRITETFGKFKIIKLIGRGGAGEVYLAVDTTLQRQVALKVLARISFSDLERFHREAVLTAKLDHTNIVKIYEISEHDNINYISMQYIDGESLDKKPLTMRQKIDAIKQIGLALDHAHRLGISHRDIKPANILIGREGRAYLTDFGIAKQVSLSGARSNISVSGMIIGTPSYMSPEQARGEIDRVDHVSDVYSLGATLYFLLTEREPYKGDSAIEIIEKILHEDPSEPRKLNKSIPAELEAIILKAMEKERETRYQSSFELARDLGFYLEGRPTMARPRSAISRILRTLKRKKVLDVIVSVCFALSLAAGLIVYWKIKEHQTSAYEIPEKMKLCDSKLDEFDSLFYMPRFNITTKFYLLDDVIKVAEELRKSDDTEVKAHGYFYRGGAFFRKGKLEEAYQDLSSAINLSQQSIFFLTRAKVALEIYSDKLSLFPTVCSVQEPLAKHKSWKEKAKEDIEKYLQSNPGEKEWLTIYAKAMISYCEIKTDAKDLLRELLGKVSREQSADLWELYAETCSIGLKLSEVLEAYEKALEIKRSDYNLYIGLGGVFVTAADSLAASDIESTVELLKRAIDAYSNALFINPSSDDAYQRRAATRHALLRFNFTEEALDEAIEDCSKAVNINPNSARAQSLRAILYGNKAAMSIQQGMDIIQLINTIDKDIENALRIASYDEYVLQSCAFALWQKGVIISYQGKDPSSEFNKSVQIYEEILNNHDECLRVATQRCRKVLEHINNMTYVLNLKIFYLLDQKKDPSNEIGKSIALLTKAIEKNANDSRSYFNLVFSYLHKGQHLVNQGIDPMGELEKSMQCVKKVHEMNPYFVSYTPLGIAYWLKLQYSSKTGYLDKSAANIAIENFTKAIDMSIRTHIESLFYLVLLHEYRGHCHFMLEDKKKAVSDWQKALELAPHMKDKFLRLIESANKLD